MNSNYFLHYILLFFFNQYLFHSKHDIIYLCKFKGGFVMKVLLTDSNDCIVFDETGQEEILHCNEFRSMYSEIFYRLEKERYLERKSIITIVKK